MYRRDPQEFQDGELPEAMGRRIVRRGRRYTPPGESYHPARPRRPRPAASGTSVQIGDVIADLTPRQAVVWLMNLDTMISLYESTTEQQLDATARSQLVRELKRTLRE